MESGIGGQDNGDRLAAELARVRDALDDLRRRPIPPDSDTLRHVVTASLSEASAPPPNLLVTAIRRLDRVDARLESMEALLGGQGALPRGGPTQGSSAARARAPALTPVTMSPAPPPDPEAIADALARRLTSVLAAQPPARHGGGGATIEDLIAALRPLVPDAARAVLRRAGREPSPQAVEVLQQTALSALEEAADSLGAGPSRSAVPLGVAARPTSGLSELADPRRFAPPPALAAAPAPPPLPPSPIDVDALAASIADRVAGTLAGQLRPPPPPVAPPPPEPERPPPPVDPTVVADAVIRRLAEQPPPQAVVSPLAMAPLLSAVGNVEAAVARLAEPDADVTVAVDRLEAGVEALARALEEDRSSQAEEVRRGFAEVNERMRAEVAAQLLSTATGDDLPGTEPSGDTAAPRAPAAAAALIGLQRDLDRLTRQMAPLTGVDLAVAVPGLAAQGQRLERSLNHILTALAAVADHLNDESASRRAGSDGLGPTTAVGEGPAGPPELAGFQDGLGTLASLVDELAADRQRFQRLGGTIDGLAELLGQVSERLDRLPREADKGPRPTAGRSLHVGAGAGVGPTSEAAASVDETSVAAGTRGSCETPPAAPGILDDLAAAGGEHDHDDQFGDAAAAAGTVAHPDPADLRPVDIGSHDDGHPAPGDADVEDTGEAGTDDQPDDGAPCGDEGVIDAAPEAEAWEAEPSAPDAARRDAAEPEDGRPTPLVPSRRRKRRTARRRGRGS